MNLSQLRALRTSIVGNSWPVIPDLPAATMLAVQQLEVSQWLRPDELVRLQMQQMTRLLEHAMHSVPYYREHFKDHLPGTTDNLSLQDFQELPILRRKELQSAGEELRSSASPAGHGKITSVRASGSTGRPVTALIQKSPASSGGC